MGSGFLFSRFLIMFYPIFFVSPTDTEENVGFAQVAACAYICEMTHGYENEVVPFIGIHLANPLCLPEVS